jgi:uncharacterized phage-associated protein
MHTLKIMKSSINRDRLVNAIVYFAKRTESCGKIKMFKLLYMLDFEHFRETGKSVTGLEYEAWQHGPVPAELMREWNAMKSDIASVVEIVPEPQFDYVRSTVKALDGVEFNDENFTPRQLRILSVIADQYLAEKSQKMIDLTHVQNGAWDRVWANGAGSHKPIPYDLAVADEAPNRDLVLESASEARGFAVAVEGQY